MSNANIPNTKTFVSYKPLGYILTNNNDSELL